jgi:hypothetical protein
MRAMQRILVLLALAACGGASNTPGDAAGDSKGGGDGSGGDAACTCSAPPAPVCADSMTLQSFSDPGSCATGTCQYAMTTTTCTFGCANGACQPKTCTPSCSSATCSDDGCGGTCGACTSGTTFTGVTATNLGIAANVVAAPDGIHLAAVRALQPLPVGCGFNPPQTGTLDVWTVPTSGAATHITIGAQVPRYSPVFTSNGYLLYFDNADPCKGRGDLWIAHADGSQPVLLATGVVTGVQVAGGTAFYSAPDPADPDPSTFDGFVYAITLPTGTPVKLASISYESEWEPSPDGKAIWVNYGYNAGDLAIYRLDGTSTVLSTNTSTPHFSGYPLWSPDSKHLAFSLVDTAASMVVIGADGSGQTTLDASCACNDFDAIAWSSDSARVAWLHRPTGGGLDAQIHTLAGGSDVSLTGIVPTTGGQVFRMTFSNDGARLYAAEGTDPNWALMNGNTATSGAASPLLSTLQADGDRFQTSWTEAPDGSVMAVLSSDTTTKVITFGGSTQSITGNGAQPKLEAVSTSPRWLVERSATALSVFPTAGSGTGTALTGYASSYDLSEWAFSGYIPFMFGWSGSTALYASNIAGTYYTAMTQDLMAWTTAASGRLGASVVRYVLADSPARVYFVTSQSALFWVPRP